MKKIFSILMVAILAVGFMTGCSKKGGEFKMGEVQENGVVLKEGDTVAVFKVKDFGDIKVKLYKDLAPKTVENFTTHAKNGYYDNVTFHRVINEFMIQGGDPEGTGTGGESIWGGYFEDEFSPKARNFNGALSMANIGQADTNSSQFFIVNAPTFTQEEIDYYKANGINISDEDAKVYMERGGTPHLDDKHTVFGMVYEGMSIVQKIMEVEVNADNAMPTTPVVIEKIEILEVK